MTRVDEYLSAIEWGWVDDCDWASIDLPLCQIIIVKQQDETYRISLGPYSYPKHMGTLELAKIRSLRLYMEILRASVPYVDNLIKETVIDNARKEKINKGNSEIDISLF